jgi:4-hydroxybenzoate polyprenyltransferase
LNPAIIGALINSALYLVCVFVAGLVTGHPWAWKLAIASIGVTFLAYSFQLHQQRMKAQPDAVVVLILFSWLLGAAAGILLLF